MQSFAVCREELHNLRSLNILDIRRLFAPPSCAACLQPVEPTWDLCKSCDKLLIPMPENVCTVCALPFDSETSSKHRCDECIRQEPAFQKVRAAFEFRGAMVPLWHRIKFGGALHPLKSLTSRALPWFKAAIDELHPDFILPVPLHFTRRFRRGFNQSYLLAQALQKRAGSSIPFLSGVRRLYRRPQAQKSRAERLASLQDGFRIQAKLSLQASKILIVDDVLTTGATAESLSRALREAGADRIEVFVLARVPSRGMS